MIRIKLLSVGKTKESWLEEALKEYLKRLQASISFEFLWARDDAHLLEAARKEEHLICLDPKGKMMDSEEFSKFLEKQYEKSGSRLCFVIGGPEGLPPELRAAATLISLSLLTFTHQIARLILVEQIYRAHEIAKGTHYHK